jgi:CRP-like cAMP-binding protein
MNELEDHILEFLGVYWDVDTYGNDCVFSYENQVPMKGIYLKKGKIQLLKRNKVVKELTEPGPYFIEELLYMNPYKLQVKILADSEVIHIDRIQLLKIVESRFPHLTDSIKALA